MISISKSVAAAYICKNGILFDLEIDLETLEYAENALCLQNTENSLKKMRPWHNLTRQNRLAYRCGMQIFIWYVAFRDNYRHVEAVLLRFAIWIRNEFLLDVFFHQNRRALASDFLKFKSCKIEEIRADWSNFLTFLQKNRK
jgi:hypothetical protein